MAEQRRNNPPNVVPGFESNPAPATPVSCLSPGQLARLMWVRNFIRRGSYEEPDIVDAVIHRFAEDDACTMRIARNRTNGGDPL